MTDASRECGTCASFKPGTALLDGVPPSCYTCARGGPGLPMWRPRGLPLESPKVTMKIHPTPDTAPAKAPLQTQVGGDHYKHLKIQPVEYCHANGIPFMEGSVIKYVTRWRGKNGVQDLKKARHFLDMLISLNEAAPV